MSLNLIGWIVLALIAGGVLALAQRRLRESSSREQPPLDPPPVPAPARLAPEVFQARIKELIDAGQTINAIKLYREQHGVGLKEAKDSVEALIAGRHPFGREPSGPVDADADIEQALREDNLIEAIKLYRDRYGVSLKEAKDACDAMRKRLRG
ncbi:hypothetical protein OV208_00175 [Corallococcus sp. bb12-1]|uniref:hypothetical protein n=1 Tax=Corallococcus sp. bb12-1 TaxID=2996784 RepID=UPI002270A3EE|nr:hypothetical protein [Corallococcus sp. bb12-1]MCY1039717.1 hypothetical protein [Corallococcus sp. bb12-1]